VFYVASVSCFRGMFRESWRHDPDARGRGTASRGPVDGARPADRACSSSSGVLGPVCVEIRGGQGKE
jgi:hypothetical protein